MTTRLFGTDGIRGPANVGKLAPAAIARLGLAVARVLRDEAPARHVPRALIGRDTRVSGPSVSAALTAGLLAGGVEVHDAGVLPTPAVALLTRRRNFDLGAVVSASHNPWRDNGLKLLGRHGHKLDDVEESAIEAAYAAADLETAVDPAIAARAHVRPRAADEYVRAFLGEFKGLRLRRLHVVSDSGNGAQCGIVAPLLRKLGARVTALGEEPDGRNINLRCGALHPRRMQRTVRELGADLGIAFDGDADRLQMCDENGKLLDGDFVLAALAPRLRRARRLPHRTVVGTLMTNGGLEIALAEQDIRLLRTPVGDRHIVAEMARHGYGLGGEPSGHLIIPRRGLLTGDALFAAVSCMRAMVQEGLRASELAGNFKAWPLQIVSMPVRERPPIDTLPRTSAALEEALRVLDGTGRVVLRYSGTEPKVRVMVESRRRRLLRPTVDRLVEALRSEVGQT